jgi:Glycosyltransferases, probably involved in cell wall biogenesis
MKQIKKAWKYYRNHGLKLLLLKSFFPYQKRELDYGKWREKHSLDEQDLKQQSEHVFNREILISIAVPTYQTPKRFLKEMIESVLEQSYPVWELCIADGSDDMDVCHIVERYAKNDKRIKLKRLSANKGIAENTNEALKMCSGEYVGLLDHDDVLAANALYEIRCAIDENSNPEVIYTDEDKISIDSKTLFDPHFKPDFNEELLRSNNYICHFLVVRNDILQKVKGLSSEYDGAQDYDFILRCTEYADSVIHIAKPLYHWRAHITSTAGNPESKLYAYESGRKAIEEHLKRRGEDGQVEYTEYLGFYHVKYKIKSHDRVAIIIVKEPGQSSRMQVKRCIASIKKTSGYTDFQIIVVDHLRDLRISDIECKFVLFVKSSIRMISHNWMEEMIGNCQRDYIGAIGIKLYNKNETVRHAGIIQGRKKYAFEGLPRVLCGYFHRDNLMQYLSGVTMDFMMMPFDIFLHLWKKFPECFLNEQMLCSRIRDMEKNIVYNPGIEAYILGISQKGNPCSGKEEFYRNSLFYI